MTMERGPDIWLPLSLADRMLPVTDARFPERGVYFVGRLRGGAGVAQVSAEAAVLARRLASRGLRPRWMQSPTSGLCGG